MAERIFELVEGTSNKFWAVAVSGRSHTVRFGRVGTAGQSKTKEFASEAAAQADADKLIAEKTGKGYVEKAAGGPAAGAPSPAAKPPGKAKKAAVAVEEGPAAPAENARGVSPPTTIDPASLAVVREVRLDPADYLVVTYRARPVGLAPDPVPFDRGRCMRELEKITSKYGYWSFEKVRVPAAMSPEEGHFWIVATRELQGVRGDAGPARTKLAGMTFDGNVPIDELRAVLAGDILHTAAVIVFQAAGAVLTTERLLELIGHPGGLPAHRGYRDLPVVRAFHTRLLPRMTDDELDRLRDALRPQVGVAQWPVAAGYAPAPPEFFIAALIGMHREVEAVVQTFPDGMAADAGNYDVFMKCPQRLVLGLGSRERVAHHMRRLRLRLNTPEYVRGWLAHTEWTGLDLVRDSVLAATGKEDAAALMDELCKVNAPEAAPVMLELWLDSKAPGAARQWLADHPGNAIAGLVPVAAGSGKLARAALDYLREVKRKGFASAIEEHLDGVTPELAAFIRPSVLEHKEKEYPVLGDAETPDDLRAGLAAVPAKATLPSWADPAALPPVLVGGAKLPDDHVRRLLAALKAAPGGPVPPVVAALRKHADPTTLDALAWQLFEMWMREGLPSKEKWAFASLGLLGGNASALKLTPLVREWPGQSKHQTAVLGLEVLRAIGTDTALMQLNGIAQKVKFQGVKTKAREMMEAIAADRGLTREQLEDRIVPDLGLDADGGRVFDFGPRQFRMLIDADLSPVVKDADGKVRGDLPKPGAKDGAGQAAAAVAEWRLLKKQLKEAVKVQQHRLEQAMVAMRRWPVADFEALFVRHPLMTNLVRRLVWAGYDDKGQLTRTFRVTDEKEYAGPDDRPATLTGVRTVGIVHPLHLDEPARGAWGQLLGEYEIVPPFPQLGRPVNRLDPADADKRELVPEGKWRIESIVMVGILDKLGWQRGRPEDGGVFHYHSKAFEAAGLTAVVSYTPGVPIGYMQGWEDQTVERVYFQRPPAADLPWLDSRYAVKLRDVDPVVVSEALTVLHVLASKGK